MRRAASLSAGPCGRGVTGPAAAYVPLVRTSPHGLPEVVLERLALVPGLQAAYLFGSRAAGTARPDSDVDLALLTAAPLERLSALTLTADLMAELGAVDLVELRRAPLTLAARIVNEGVPVLVPDEQAWLRHKTRTLLDYWDTEPMRRELDRGQADRIREGRFGRP